MTACSWNASSPRYACPNEATQIIGQYHFCPDHSVLQAPASVQGWPVVKILPGAVYVRLPVELRRPTGGCSCQYCVAHPDETPTWDTLGIPVTGRMITWSLHAPEWKPL